MNVPYLLYINLEYRKDRNENMLKQVKLLGIENYERIEAIKKPIGFHGCAESFVIALERALNIDVPYIIICEDDFDSENHEYTIRDVNRFLDEHKEWDVILTGGKIMGKYEKFEYYIKPERIYSCPGYIIKKEYLPKFLEVLKTARDYNRKYPKNNMCVKYAADTIITPLIQSDNWYMISPHGSIQMPGFSDLANCYIDNRKYMKISS